MIKSCMPQTPPPCIPEHQPGSGGEGLRGRERVRIQDVSYKYFLVIKIQNIKQKAKTTGISI